MTENKKMYKVLCPLEKKGGGTYWMRLGTAFTNRDNSLNVYLDAIPPTAHKSNRYELQIRELTEEDLRRRDTQPSQGENTSSAYAPNGFNRDARAATAAPALPDDLNF